MVVWCVPPLSMVSITYSFVSKKSQLLCLFGFAAVLGKVKDFLGVLSEANNKLQVDAKVWKIILLLL